MGSSAGQRIGGQRVAIGCGEGKLRDICRMVLVFGMLLPVVECVGQAHAESAHSNFSCRLMKVARLPVAGGYRALAADDRRHSLAFFACGRLY